MTSDVWLTNKAEIMKTTVAFNLLICSVNSDKVMSDIGKTIVVDINKKNVVITI